MAKSKKTAGRPETIPAAPAGREVVTTALKWVGGATAVLSLIFGLNQLGGLVSRHRQQKRKVRELLKTAEMEGQTRDYATAWSSLEEADRLTNGRDDVRAAEESIGMVWLENAHVNPDKQKFADIVDKVEPALDRGASAATGTRKADLLAHLGWGEFLRSRDDFSGRTPDDYYRQALQIDPQNPYAHAMLGHWILWNHGSVADAQQQFSLALASGRGHAWVRELQLAGLEDLHNDAADSELIRVVNDMRKSNEQPNPRTRHAVWTVYFFGFDPESAERQVLLAAVPPAEHLSTFDWLFETPDFNQSETWLREFYRAILQEATGQHAEALKTLLWVRSQLPHAVVARIRKEVEAKIAQLSKVSAREPGSDTRQ
jgi:hypothetical protein